MEDLVQAEAHRYLKQYFGYETFRPQQAEVIERVLSGKDSMVLMPTGGGKSLCFQIPALMKKGVAVVVSPLISLMKDQVEALNANGISAAYLNSSQDHTIQTEVMYQALKGKIKLLYISPERLITEFSNFFCRLPLSLVAVDEAHCISSWGHDFRPEYTQLSLIKKRFPQVPLVALTATADKTTRSDIVRQLSMIDPQVFVSSFDRPNLSLKVRPGLRKKEKDNEIIDFIKARENDYGIVYCLSRDNTEKLAASLQNEGISASYYHAGMRAEERDRVQEDFIHDRVQVICATVAFGMGIDKPNVRFVIHYNLPKNIESYYQEIGRGGRDGLKCETVLYFNYGDIVLLNRFLEESGQEDLNREKLQRMQQFAEAQNCRRQILLSYFGETLSKPCGNCDVCKNPPKRIDGTILVQKAVSALMRIGRGVGAQMLIQILRGAQTHELLERGYNKIKTYGAGKDVSFNDWQQYLLQMLNLGFLEIRYADNFTLWPTPYGQKVVMDREKVKLAAIQNNREVKETLAVKVEKPIQRSMDDELFNELRRLRREISEDMEVPPYVIFNDASLKEMARDKPQTSDEFLEISGVGKHKLKQFGVEFLNLISGFNAIKEKEKGSSFEKTQNLYLKGYTVDEIARANGLNKMTVYSHLAHLYKKGAPINIFEFVTEKEIDLVHKAINGLGGVRDLKSIYVYLQERVTYYKIRLAISHLEREKFIK